MFQSKLFTKTRKDAPKDEVSRNAILLTRAGYIHKEMAGVYSILPLGLRVLRKIENIIRNEMNNIDGEEISLTALQDKANWEKTGRWDDVTVDNWFKTRLKNDTELGLAYSHEPPVTALMKDHISSYRDLPAYPYQFQIKFRNELRAKSGIFRGREFLMKDMYSFNKNQADLDAFYDKAIEAYKNVFNKVGIGHITYLTTASGGIFGTKYSHEFQTLTPVGEDTIYIHKGKNIAINKEMLNDETLAILGVNRDELVEDKSIEIGNIYKLGTFYSQPLGLNFKDESGASNPVIMGCYGIGVTRLLGVIAEINSDEQGLIWPESVAPFNIHMIVLNDKSGKVLEEAKKIYKTLTNAGLEVLLDDRDVTAGVKFGDSDLIGIPKRLVISEKTLADNVVELKNRKGGEAVRISIDNLLREIN